MYVCGNRNKPAFRFSPGISYLLLFLSFLMACCTSGFSQTADSIFFNPYTDSLKKGTFNYINVEGKLSNGRFIPMTAKEIEFSASAGKFEGNSLFLSLDIPDERILINARLKSDSTKRIKILLPVKHVE